MPNKTQPKGTCAYCETEIARSGAARHLEACRERRAAIEKADAKAGRSETLLHLRVQDEQDGTFWLDLEMRGTARIDALDHYLRAIWLECCGHLSRFAAGGWGSREIGMGRPAASVIQPGVTYVHTYDFGTTSYTMVKLVGTRAGAPTTKHPIALLARNLPPAFPCIECERPATRFCTECWIEEEVWGTLCDEHARTHPHDDYGPPTPLVNSPRLGLCGYDGPANPPY